MAVAATSKAGKSEPSPKHNIEAVRQAYYDRIAKHDAIYLGAVGWPGVPDHVSLWGLLIPIRREFDEYVNLRPVHARIKGATKRIRVCTSCLRSGKVVKA